MKKLFILCFLIFIIFQFDVEAGQILALDRDAEASARPHGDGSWHHETIECGDLNEVAGTLGLDSLFVAPTIDAPKMDRADMIAVAALNGSPAPDPIADFLARPSIGSGEAPGSSSRSRFDAVTGLPGGTQGRVSESGPGGASGPGGPGGPDEPEEAKSTRYYTTASTMAVVLTLIALGLLWWRLDRDAR
jgi:hypothetical protein